MTFEEMYEKCGEIYYNDYADGEYCHEQSFRWGFQEAWELFDKMNKEEPNSAFVERLKNHCYYDFGDVCDCENCKRKDKCFKEVEQLLKEEK